jgi:hypothetical protein
MNEKNKSQLVGIISPPYSNALGKKGRKYTTPAAKFLIQRSNQGREEELKYSDNPLNIGNMKDNQIETETEDLDLTQFTKGELYWYGCYESFKNWRKYVVPESYRHPAKMAPKLCDKIFKHLKKLGLLHEGITIIDFMAGISTTGILASLHGYNYIGVELEPRFIELSKKNYEKLKRSGINAKWELIQGDSRKLSELLKEKGYAGIVSPPYGDIELSLKNRTDKSAMWIKSEKGYKHIPYSEDNIGSLSDKKLIGIISPPYGNTQLTFIKNKILENGKPYFRPCIVDTEYNYGSTNPENIGNLPDKKLIGITSPPYENTLNIHNEGENPKGSSAIKRERGVNGAYSFNPQNIGNQKGETYLTAMLKVYQEAYKSGISPLVVVTKNPTKKGKLRRLDIDTAKLLMMAGYEIYDYHRALLFKEYPPQKTLTGEIKKEVKGRLSFFRRLMYLKNIPIAQWEDIIIAVIPNTENKKSD